MDLGTVYDAVLDARVKWYYIGLELKVNPRDLDSIKSLYRDNPEDCLRETLKKFLSQTNPRATWNRLADALDARSIGEGQLAEEVRDRGLRQ